MSPNEFDEAAELGRPVDELLQLEDGLSPQFLLGVRKKIDRRRTTGQLVSFSWNLPRVILMEMITWLSQIQELFGEKNEPNRDRPIRGTSPEDKGAQ
jgi:hypothetical protein